jgi:hypothetical protein
MPMERDSHETILNELLNPELEHSRRTELLQQLRVDYNSVIDEHTTHTQRIEKLTADNNDLVVSNSKLFRQIGISGSGKEEQEEKKEFSETITIEQIEKGLNS